MLILKKSVSDIPKLPQSAYVGVCIGAIDLGEQQDQYKKEAKAYKRKLLVIFEIVGEFVDVDGEKQPRWLSKEFTASLNDKSSLTALLKALTGETEFSRYETEAMLGKGCQLQVSLNQKEDRKYNHIDGIIGLPKGMTVGAPISDTLLFDMDRPETYEVLEKLPAWMRERVERSPTWRSLRAGTETMDMDGDDCEGGGDYDARLDRETGEVLRGPAAGRGLGSGTGAPENSGSAAAPVAVPF